MATQSATRRVPEFASGDPKIVREKPEIAAYRNYKALIARATDVFGDEITASRWLSMPCSDLDGRVPLEVAQRDAYQLGTLEPLFLRIEHGIDF